MTTPLAGQMTPLASARRRAAFAPTSLPGLKLWLRADSLALADGNPVAAWADLSGNGNDVSGSGAARPTFRAAALNGKPVAQFAGAQALAGAVSFTSRTIIYVASITDGVPFGNAVGGSVPHYFGIVAGSHFLLNENSTGLAVAPVTGSFRCFAGTIGASLAASGIRVNGAPQTPTATFDGFWTTDFPGTPAVGQRGDGGALFTGDLAELVVYDSALADADRARVEAYLSAKYALGF
jgi:hypothetical protein